MTDKREERRARSEQAKELKERLQRQRVMRTRLYIAAGVLGIMGVVYAAMREPAGSRPGQVWSPEHGHWHDQ